MSTNTNTIDNLNNPSWRLEKITEMLKTPHRFNEWEKIFLNSVKNIYKLSDKQKKILFSIIKEYDPPEISICIINPTMYNITNS